MIDWLNDNSGAIQAISVVVLAMVTAVYAGATLVMAWVSRKQAEASVQMAESTMRPVILLWTECVDELEQRNSYHVFYQNIGNGPAVNIALRIAPADGVWNGTPRRVGLGLSDPAAHIAVEILNPMADEAISVVAEYSDSGGSTWRTTLKLDRDRRVLTNGESLVERVGP